MLYIDSHCAFSIFAMTKDLRHIQSNGNVTNIIIDDTEFVFILIKIECIDVFTIDSLRVKVNRDLFVVNYVQIYIFIF